MRRWMAAPASREAIESLAAHLSVGETYFFREPASFEACANAVLPP
jgi:chemotaxis protein methyltransferase CheR